MRGHSRSGFRFIVATSVGALGLSLLSGCGDDSDTAAGTSDGPDGLRKVSVATAPGFYSSLPFQLAQEEGIFAEHGIETEVVDVSVGGTLISSVISGSADVGMNVSPPVVGLSVDGGQDIRFFCGGSQKYFFELLVAPDSDLPSYEEAGSLKAVFEAMQGKTIGILQVGSTADYILKGAIQEAGVDPSTIDFVSVGAGPAGVSAFEAGQVDVLQGYPFITQQLVAEGEAEVLVDLYETSELVSDQYSAGFIGEKSWIEANPDIAQSICDAYGEGITMMKDPANKNTVNAILERDFGLTGDRLLDLARERIAPAVTNEISDDHVDRTFDSLRDVGAIPPEVDVTAEDSVLRPQDVR